MKRRYKFDNNGCLIIFHWIMIVRVVMCAYGKAMLRGWLNRKDLKPKRSRPIAFNALDIIRSERNTLTRCFQCNKRRFIAVDTHTHSRAYAFEPKITHNVCSICSSWVCELDVGYACVTVERRRRRGSTRRHKWVWVYLCIQYILYIVLYYSKSYGSCAIFLSPFSIIFFDDKNVLKTLSTSRNYLLYSVDYRQSSQMPT